MTQDKRLTEQQIKFVNELITNEGKITGTQAAVNAGYGKAGARVRASDLQNPKRFPLVVEHTKKIREEFQKKHELLFNKHIMEFDSIAEQAQQVMKNNLKKGKLRGINNFCKKITPVLRLAHAKKTIKVYLAEESSPYSTNHFKIGMTTQENVSDRGKFTDNPFGMNYICYIEYLAANGFNLEKSLHNFFRFYSTNNQTYNGSTEWFFVKNRNKLIKTFKKVGMRLLERKKCMGVFSYEVE